MLRSCDKLKMATPNTIQQLVPSWRFFQIIFLFASKMLSNILKKLEEEEEEEELEEVKP